MLMGDLRAAIRRDFDNDRIISAGGHVVLLTGLLRRAVNIGVCNGSIGTHKTHCADRDRTIEPALGSCNTTREMEEFALEHALQGIRVVELAQMAAVPMAGRLLGDLGAEVLHLEHPLKGDILRIVLAGQGGDLGGPNYIWENYNRNKKSMKLDVSTKGGQEILYRLVKEADVFLTNMRPFEREKYAFEYSTLSQINPKLIYGSITGTGKRGSEKNEPGYDATGYWSKAGIAHSIMPPGAAPDCRVGGFGDNLGGLSLAFGITSALFARERTGKGQEVDLSLLQTGVFQLSWNIAEVLVTGADRPSVDRKNMPNALMNSYRTQDQRWFMLTLLQPDRYWSALCKAIELEELEHDPRFSNFGARLENHAALTDLLDQVFMTKTLKEWETRMAGIPSAPVQKLTEVIADPQARADQLFVSLDHPQHGAMEVVGAPFHLSETPPTVRTPAPELGQHTEEALVAAGYTWEEIEQFEREGII